MLYQARSKRHGKGCIRLSNLERFHNSFALFRVCRAWLFLDEKATQHFRFRCKAIVKPLYRLR